MMIGQESIMVRRWMVPLCMESQERKPPMWLHSIMKNEMKYLNGILHGKEVDDEFRPLLTGEAARAAIATADACTKSRFEDRKVKLSEIIGEGSTI